MEPTRIVILGGGVGGTLVANLLARRLTRRQAHITLIDRTGRHVYRPGLLYVPFGGPPPERLERAERSLLDHTVNLVVGDAARINTISRCVEMADGLVYPFDELVIATGARLAEDGLPGFAEGAYHFFNPAAAMRLHAALRGFRGGHLVIGMAEAPYPRPPAPLEFTFMIDECLRQRGLREQTTITFLSPGHRIFPVESVASLLAPLMDERGIRYELRFNAEVIDPATRRIVSLEGRAIDYDLLVFTPPFRGASIISRSSLGNSHGWVPTDHETLQSRADPHIYAIGDATDLPLSKSGSVAHFEAKVVASRIVAQILGKGASARYTGDGMYFIETGHGKATQVIFDYAHPPQPPQPSTFYHFEKSLLNRAYWYVVPRGIV